MTNNLLGYFTEYMTNLTVFNANKTEGEALVFVNRSERTVQFIEPQISSNQIIQQLLQYESYSYRTFSYDLLPKNAYVLFDGAVCRIVQMNTKSRNYDSRLWYEYYLEKIRSPQITLAPIVNEQADVIKKFLQKAFDYENIYQHNIGLQNEEITYNSLQDVLNYSTLNSSYITFAFGTYQNTQNNVQEVNGKVSRNYSVELIIRFFKLEQLASNAPNLLAKNEALEYASLNNFSFSNVYSSILESINIDASGTTNIPTLTMQLNMSKEIATTSQLIKYVDIGNITIKT